MASASTARELISFTEACEKVRSASASHTLTQEVVPIERALGRVSAQAVVSSLDVQPFDNAAMDGYAVACKDLLTASPDRPVPLVPRGIVVPGISESLDALEISGIGDISQGDELTKIASTAITTTHGNTLRGNVERVQEGGWCRPITTGAMVPQGIDAVVPVELVTQTDDGRVWFTTTPTVGANIRRKGEDIACGDTLLPVGQLLSPQHIMPLATCGVATVSVFRRLRIALVSTGKELTDNLVEPLKEGCIYNSNRYYMMAWVERMGAQVVLNETVPDRPQGYADCLREAERQRADIVVSSGAVSVGRFDFVRKTLEETLKASIVYHGIALRPGKPNLFAVLPSGVMVFGFPGNPISTAVGLRFILNVAWRAMTHRPLEKPDRVPLVGTFNRTISFHQFLKAKRTLTPVGGTGVLILPGQESFKVQPLGQQDVWVALPPSVQSLRAGDLVDTLPYGTARLEGDAPCGGGRCWRVFRRRCRVLSVSVCGVRVVTFACVGFCAIFHRHVVAKSAQLLIVFERNLAALYLNSHRAECLQ